MVFDITVKIQGYQIDEMIKELQEAKLELRGAVDDVYVKFKNIQRMESQ